MNRFVLNETSYHGAGAIAAIATEAKNRGFKKAFVCSDPDLVKFHVTDKVLKVLTDNGLAYELYSNIKPNPTIENVQTGVAAFKKSKADYIIAIGGGSSMDTAKAIGIIIATPNMRTCAASRAPFRRKNPPFPSSPFLPRQARRRKSPSTTSSNRYTYSRKFVCVDPHDIPVVAIVDPEMMSTMPKVPDRRNRYGRAHARTSKATSPRAHGSFRICSTSKTLRSFPVPCAGAVCQHARRQRGNGPRPVHRGHGLLQRRTRHRSLRWRTLSALCTIPLTAWQTPSSCLR